MIEIIPHRRLRLLNISWIWWRSSDDETSETVDSESDALGYVFVLHWADDKGHVANLWLKKSD
jgi:hypothetical protein